MDNLLQVTGLIAVPVIVTIVAAALSVRRRPGPYLMSAVQHFAAGVVLAAVAGEVLPALREEGHIVWAVAGFSAGIVLVIALEYIGEREAARETAKEGVAASPEGASGSGGTARLTASQARRSPAKVATAALPLGMLIPVAVDLLMDGVLVGMGASLGFAQALILTIALTIEVLFLGVSLTASLRSAGQGAARSVGVVSVVAMTMAVGAIGGALLLTGASPQVMAAALAFGAAALLYLAVEELMLEAHEHAETPWLTALFFVGFVLIYVLGEVAA